MKRATKWLLLCGVTTGMLSLSALGYMVLDKHVTAVRTAEVHRITKQTETVVQPLDQPTRRSVPIEVAIPFLHTQAPIQPVGLDEYGRMATVPTAHVVAWYTGGSTPGQPGNAIFAGHRDWNGALGTFWKLETLPIGSKVYVTLSNGTTEVFRVITNHSYPDQAVPKRLLSLGGPARLTLITCVGVFVRSKGGYQSRVVVQLVPQVTHAT